MRSVPNKITSLLTFRILFTHLKFKRSEENHHLLSSGAKRRQNELRIFFLHNKNKKITFFLSLCVPAYKARLKSEMRKSKEMCEEQNLFWLLLLFHEFFFSRTHSHISFVYFFYFFFYFHFCF